MPFLAQLFVQARSLFSFVMIELLLKKFLTDANGYAILFKVILTTLPKTAGAVRRKVKTPAEERTKLTQNFVNLSVCGRRGFFPKSDIKCCDGESNTK